MLSTIGANSSQKFFRTQGRTSNTSLGPKLAFDVRQLLSLGYILKGHFNLPNRWCWRKTIFQQVRYLVERQLQRGNYNTQIVLVLETAKPILKLRYSMIMFMWKKRNVLGSAQWTRTKASWNSSPETEKEEQRN